MMAETAEKEEGRGEKHRCERAACLAASRTPHRHEPATRPYPDRELNRSLWGTGQLSARRAGKPPRCSEKL